MRLIINSKKKCPWKIASWQVECSVYKQAEIFHQKCDKILLTVRKPKKGASSKIDFPSKNSSGNID